ncbi:MAG: AAA family ATPase [Verrucomicrobia bacterium]|nr:AAA family ATPase [Verrucomicrobiota bacterium]
MPFERSVVGEVVRAVARKVPLMQVLIGPRQVGKTTAARQIARHLAWPMVSASADGALQQPQARIETQWRLARTHEAGPAGSRVLMVLDEIHDPARCLANCRMPGTR